MPLILDLISVTVALAMMPGTFAHHYLLCSAHIMIPKKYLILNFPAVGRIRNSLLQLNASILNHIMGTVGLIEVLRPENLSLTTILVGSTFILILAAVVPVIRQWYRLRHIPGPFLNSITSLVLVYHSWKEDHCTYVYRLCQEYGPLVRVAPNVVVFSDGPTFRYICSVKANYTKGLWFEFTRWDLERYSCIAMRDNESRKERKMKLLPAVRSHLILNTYT